MLLLLMKKKHIVKIPFEEKSLKFILESVASFFFLTVELYFLKIIYVFIIVC